MLGRLGEVSALTLGGGGLGQLWGTTDREEAVATVREAVDAGVTLLDLAPRYGDGEAERVIGEAFGGRLPEGVRVTTKHRVSNPPGTGVFERMERSLTESLKRTKLSSVDVFFLHALSMNGVDTVVLGVKNRRLLREGLAAEARGPLADDLLDRIDAALATA